MCAYDIDLVERTLGSYDALAVMVGLRNNLSTRRSDEGAAPEFEPSVDSHAVRRAPCSQGLVSSA